MRDCKKMHHPFTCQLAVAIALSLAGITLLFMGFWCTPAGEIHNSVLVGSEQFQELAGRPVAFAHVSNLLLLLEPCGGFLPAGLFPHNRLMIDFHKIHLFL